MKRLFIADDERPVIEGLSHIVRRDLEAEFEIVGTASTGREAIERVSELSPDLVLMDVRMPGISGLDAIREIRNRGSTSSFILITAYERFDIAREAVGLGVLDYLLKPVAKDRLIEALRTAAAFINRRTELERREILHREREEGLRDFVEASFLELVMLGQRFGPELEKYRSDLGISEPLALALAAVFVSPLGAPDPAAEARAAHEAFRATVHYKTRALAGPLVLGHCLVLLPLRNEGEAAKSVESLRSVIELSHSAELARGRIRLGFGSARPFADATQSWAEALSALLGIDRQNDTGRLSADHASFEADQGFLDALLELAPERADLAFERLIESVRAKPELSVFDTYRMVALFGAACRLLVNRGLLDIVEVEEMMDLRGLASAADPGMLCLAARARYSKLTAALERTPHRSPVMMGAVSFLKENFNKPISLELVADFIGLSPNRLSKLFIEETGRGFSDFLIAYRIEKAKELLSMPGASIKLVSAACGYPDPNYFSRLFKKVTGLTPSAFSSSSMGGDEVAP